VSARFTRSQSGKAREEFFGVAAPEMKEHLVAAHRAHVGREQHAAEIQVALLREVTAQQQQGFAFGQHAQEDERVTVVMQ
jgi:hypothetical protein